MLPENNFIKMTKKENRDFARLIGPWKNDKYLVIMKEFTQHGTITTFDHCVSVAKCAFLINRRLHLHADEEKLISGAMLHDFFLYDWHGTDHGRKTRPNILRQIQNKKNFPKSEITGEVLGVGPGNWTHSYKHPLMASENAQRFFDVSEDVQHIIEAHMWPYTFWRFPKSKEAWIICMADKWASSKETMFTRKWSA